MTFRTWTKPDGLRRAGLVLSPVLITAVCAVLATNSGSGLRAQDDLRRLPPGMSRPMPGSFSIQGVASPPPAPVPVQNLVAFETAFTRQLNDAIRNPPANSRVVVLVSHKVWRDIVDERAIVVTGLANIVTLTHAQIEDVRDAFTRSVDRAILSEMGGKAGIRALGYGTIHENTMTGKISVMAGNSAEN